MGVTSICASIGLWVVYGIVILYQGFKELTRYKSPSKRELKMAEYWEKKYGKKS